MVVMLLQQHIPPLAAHPHCQGLGQSLGPNLGHSPIGSSSYEKVVQLDAVTPSPSADVICPCPVTGLATGLQQPPQQPPQAASAPQLPPPPQPPQHGQGLAAGLAPGLGHGLHYDNRAMQYYRLWIYTCNGLLLVCVLGFAVVACHTVVFDHRRDLVPGLSLLQPTFLYGYLAVLSQSGFIQMIGCLGARRLNQKLLNIYWLLLLLLLFGDAMVGVVWLFRFESICEELRPWLRQRLLQEYGVDQYFTHTWDAYQRDNRCCGVQGPADYQAMNRSLGWLPDSCCRPLATLTNPPPPRPAALRNFHYHGTTTSTPSTTTVGLEDEYHIFSALPDSEGRPGIVPDLADLYCGGIGGELNTLDSPGLGPGFGPGGGGGSSSSSSSSSSSVGSGGGSSGSIPTGGGRIITHPLLRATAPPPRYYPTGCEARLTAWLRSAADMLFIVGYCILGFVKVCFLGILRYEIKEMIQKIRMLQGELNAPTLSSPDQDPQGRKSPQQQAARFSNNNGSLVTGRGPQQQDDSPVLGSSRTPQERRGRADSGTTPLLLQPADSLQTTPLHQNPGGPGGVPGGGGGGGMSSGATAATSSGSSGVTPGLAGTSMSVERMEPPTSLAGIGSLAGTLGGPVQMTHTPLLHHRHHHHHHHHHLSLQGTDGNDSDTNSHCALLIDEGAGGGESKMTRQGSNGNNNYELQELHDINRVLLARNRHRTDI